MPVAANANFSFSFFLTSTEKLARKKVQRAKQRVGVCVGGRKLHFAQLFPTTHRCT